MKNEFEISDMGKFSYFLGMEFKMSKQGMMIHKRKYVKEILKIFKMEDLNYVSSPVKPNLKLEKHEEEDKVDVTLFKQIVESLRFVCNTRPDIGFSVGLVRRYMSEPMVSHMKVVRRILRYLKGSRNYRILFQRDSKSKEVVINFCSDVDWYGDKEDRRSTNGYSFKYLVPQSHGAREINMWWHCHHVRLNI